MRFTVNIGAHFCGRELFFIWLMLPLSGGVIEKCAAADKDTKKSWAAIVKPLPASLYPGRTGVRPHASPVPESSMLQWPPVLTTSKTHAEVPSRQQESSEATVRTHPKRRPDRKRQYYRNPSTERFDQQIEALANEVNRLKKQLHGPHRESHKTALLDLAFQMTERDPHPLRASPKALALLANAFSKLAKYQEGATALDCKRQLFHVAKDNPNYSLFEHSPEAFTAQGNRLSSASTVSAYGSSLRTCLR